MERVCRKYYSLQHVMLLIFTYLEFWIRCRKYNWLANIKQPFRNIIKETERHLKNCFWIWCVSSVLALNKYIIQNIPLALQTHIYAAYISKICIATSVLAIFACLNYVGWNQGLINNTWGWVCRWRWYGVIVE